MKQVHHEKDEKVEYARSFFLNARRPHIKNGIGYKAGDKHNSRVNTRGQEFIKFTKGNIQHEKKQNIKTTNNASYSYANASITPHVMNSLIMVISVSILHQIPWLIHYQAKPKELQMDFNLKSLWENQEIPNYRIPNPCS
jgi:hypothetical protein